MAEKKTYRAIVGAVQFPPQEKEAAGKTVRSVVIGATGFKEQAVRVYVTVWPSHADFEINQGDVLFVEGAYSQGKGTNKDTGASVTYHNISATRIAKLGTAVEGSRPDVETADDEVGDDDIPF